MTVSSRAKAVVVQVSILRVPAAAAGITTLRGLRGLGRMVRYPLMVGTAAILVTLAMEAILRGSLSAAFAFLADPSRPALATVLVIALAFAAADALMRRAGQSVLIVAPALLVLAWVGREKLFYLGDPPYPTDFLYARQIAELMPLMLAERPLTGLMMIFGGLLGAGALFLLWRQSRRMARIGFAGRFARVAVAVPALVWLGAQMDYAHHSSLRAQLKISPKMWDQKANYAHNGLLLAFALNVPMANVAAPAGYSAERLAAIVPDPRPVFVPAIQPDIIMVMSESFWDPTRLPRTTLAPDPIAFTRKLQSGHVFSPEFGGMTANVEFEALTGFSNAMLPYGSIPYQQYVRGEMPSLASFLRAEGYATLAMHPFQGWFWNRTNVYEAFGFERFLDQDELGEIEKRGRLASDGALTDRIIAEADASEKPVFLFAVTLQNHGPYEPGRYEDERIEVKTRASEAAREAIRSFSEGMMDSDQALERLIRWAERRERETIVVFFGDHLPPLGPTWPATGFMDRNVSDRFGAPAALTRERETPLVVWSNRQGAIGDIGTVSPSLLPLHTLRAARIEHPFYTGFLGALEERWRVIDRHLLVDAAGKPTTGWTRARGLDPLLDDYRLFQYDTMFGGRHAAPHLFPDGPSGYYPVARPLPSAADPV